jgi:hypothetical protein
LQAKSCFRVSDERHWNDALFLGIGGLAGAKTHFSGQGKYAVDILKRFQMEDCRPMSTPMITDWKKLNASEMSWLIPRFIVS